MKKYFYELQEREENISQNQNRIKSLSYIGYLNINTKNSERKVISN